MGLRLQRALGTVTSLTPGQYTKETATGMPCVSCPACGGLSEIAFAVYRGGVVSHIWSCEYASCPFQSYLTLESWDEEVLR